MVGYTVAVCIGLFSLSVIGLRHYSTFLHRPTARMIEAANGPNSAHYLNMMYQLRTSSIALLGAVVLIASLSIGSKYLILGLPVAAFSMATFVWLLIGLVFGLKKVPPWLAPEKSAGPGG